MSVNGSMTLQGAASINVYKHLAQCLERALTRHAPHVTLTHSQRLYVIAALYGTPNWQTLRASPDRVHLPHAAAVNAVHQALKWRGAWLSDAALLNVLAELVP
jgi:hypothetical protein